MVVAGTRWREGEMSTDALKFEIPKLPELDKEDIKAIRSFLPGKLLGRTAAILSLVLLVLGFVIAIKVSLHQFPDLEHAIPAWAYGCCSGSAFLLLWSRSSSNRLRKGLAGQCKSLPSSWVRNRPVTSG